MGEEGLDQGCFLILVSKSDTELVDQRVCILSLSFQHILRALRLYHFSDFVWGREVYQTESHNLRDYVMRANSKQEPCGNLPLLNPLEIPLSSCRWAFWNLSSLWLPVFRCLKIHVIFQVYYVFSLFTFSEWDAFFPYAFPSYT